MAAGDVLIQMLQWAIPSGGLGAAIAWAANRKANAARTAKSVHDTYKTMYEDISALLEETQKKYAESTRLTEELTTESQKTRRALNRLSRAIEAIQLCPHRASCPVSGELSLSTDGGDGDEKRGKPRQRDGGKRDCKDVDGKRERRHGDGDAPS